MKKGGPGYRGHNLMGFQRKFRSDKSCLEYLRRKRWPNGFICPRCGANPGQSENGEGLPADRGNFANSGGYFSKKRRSAKAGWWSVGRNVYECTRCHHQTSLTAGTIFHKTRIPLKKWFWMLFLMGQDKHGASVKGMQKLLKIGSYETVWLMAHKIRKAMADRDKRYRLSGLVEMDEGYFGGKAKGKNKEKPYHGKTPVLVAVENRGKNARFAAMRPVEGRTNIMVRESAPELLGTHAEVKTDFAGCYNRIREFKTWKHHPVKVCIPEKASRELPWVHILISNSKRFILGTHHGVSPKHLHRYLSEYCYRFNRRFWEDQLFDRLLLACARSTSITQQELSG